MKKSQGCYGSFTLLVPLGTRIPICAEIASRDPSMRNVNMFAVYNVAIGFVV